MNERIEISKIGLSVNTSFIMEHCYADPGDVVFVAGTLIEGIGNPCSDLDVYVVTNEYRKSGEIDLARHHRVIGRDREIIRPGDDDRQVLLIHTVVPGTSVKVDVEYKTFDKVAELLGRIDEIFEYARRNLILLTKRLTDREEVFIHRLLNGKPLQNQGVFADLRGKLPRSRYTYVAYRWVASDFAILLDLAGAWQAGDVDRAVEIARENVINQTSGYLRLCGITNLRRKWILTYLRNLDKALSQTFLNLMYLTGIDDERSKWAYVLRTLDYVDDLFVKGVPLLASIPEVPSSEEGIDLLRQDKKSNCVPNSYSDWEYEYREKAYGGSSKSTKRRFQDLPRQESRSLPLVSTD